MGIKEALWIGIAPNAKSKGNDRSEPVAPGFMGLTQAAPRVYPEYPFISDGHPSHATSNLHLLTLLCSRLAR